MLEGARAERWQRKRTGLPFPNVVFGGSVTTEKQSSSSWIRFFISDVPGSIEQKAGERAIFPTLSASRTRRHIASLRSWVVSHPRLPPCPSESETHLFTPACSRA